MFRPVKMMPLIDCLTDEILDTHRSMKQPYDTQFASQVVKSNLEELSVLAADKEMTGSYFITNFGLKVSNRCSSIINIVIKY